MLLKKTNRKRRTQDIDFEEMRSIIKDNKDVVLLDVRSCQEFNEGHLVNAINIPLQEIKKKIQETIKDKNCILVVYCTSGLRSKKAAMILQKYGFQNIYNLKNGIEEWVNYDVECVNGDIEKWHMFKSFFYVPINTLLFFINLFLIRYFLCF